MQKEKVLVTGAGGMVGSHMVEVLWNQGLDVVGTYYKPTVDIEEIPSKIRLIQCDVRYWQNVLNIMIEFRPSRIFHLAAQSYPTVSWDQPFATFDTNANGTVSIFESIKFIRKHFDPSYDPVVVVACSSAEYGSSFEKLPAGEKIKESAELLPLHPYGVSKVCQDLLSYQYFANDKIRVIRARIFNTTGARKVNDVCSDFVSRAIKSFKRGDNPCHILVGNLDSHRAIQDCQDLISALLLLSEKGTWGDVYNICAQKTVTGRDIVKAIEKALNTAIVCETDPKLLRPTDEKVIWGDVSKLVQDTGWKQTIALEDTIRAMIEYRMKREG